jgi:hypothetical protein
MTYTVLYDDDELRVVHRRGSSPYSLVTFGGLIAWTLVRNMWAEEPVEKLDLEAVGLLGKRSNWYPLASVERAVPAVRAALRPLSIGYGYSMGGYGVLKHGRRLGLDRVVAVSPQMSIDPADVPRDPRYHAHFDPALHARMRVRAEEVADWSLVIYDPKDIHDRYQAALLDDCAQLAWHHYPYLGHGTISMLRGTATLGRFASLAAAGEMGAVRDFLRGLRPESGPWFAAMARANARRGRWGRAERLWPRAIELGESPRAVERDRAAIRAAALRSRKGEPASAVSSLNGAVRRAVAAGDQRAAVDAALQLTPDKTEADVPRAAIEAAIAIGNTAAVQMLARLGIATDMPRWMRADCAARLVRGGQPGLALGVLLADPAPFVDGRGQGAALGVLRQVAAMQATDPVARHTAQHLLRRLINAVPEQREPAPERYRFAGPAGAATAASLLGPETEIRHAPSLPPSVVTEARRFLSAAADAVELSEAPRVWMLQDVFVNRLGQVWRASGGVFRPQSRPVPRASLDAMADARRIPQAVLAVRPDGDPSGWLIEGLPSLAWRLDTDGDDTPVLVREDTQDHVAQAVRLGAAGAAPLLVPVGDAVRVDTLLVSDVTLAQRGHHAAFQGMLSRLAQRTGPAATAAPVCLRAQRRTFDTIENDVAWRALLAEQGVRELMPDDVPFAELLAEVNGARTVILEPGSTFGILGLAPPGRRVFEVLALPSGTLAARLRAAQLSRIQGHEHHLWIDEAPPPRSGALRLTIDALRAPLAAFLAG